MTTDPTLIALEGELIRAALEWLTAYHRLDDTPRSVQIMDHASVCLGHAAQQLASAVSSPAPDSYQLALVRDLMRHYGRTPIPPGHLALALCANQRMTVGHILNWPT